MMDCSHFRWHWQHLAGVAVFVVVCGGWLLLVWTGHRDEFVHKMLQQELAAQIITDYGKYLPGQRFWEAPLSTAIDFLPWTPLGISALVKSLRRGSKTDGRSFERFLACWFVVGLILFSI